MVIRIVASKLSRNTFNSNRSSRETKLRLEVYFCNIFYILSLFTYFIMKKLNIKSSSFTFVNINTLMVQNL